MSVEADVLSSSDEETRYVDGLLTTITTTRTLRRVPAPR